MKLPGTPLTGNSLSSYTAIPRYITISISLKLAGFRVPELHIHVYTNMKIERQTKRKNERKIDRSINRSGQSIAASQDLTKKKVSAKRKSPYV